MIRKAMREGWEVPDKVCEAVVGDLCQVFEEAEADPESEYKDGMTLATMYLAIQLEGQNQELEHEGKARVWPTRETEDIC